MGLNVDRLPGTGRSRFAPSPLLSISALFVVCLAFFLFSEPALHADRHDDILVLGGYLATLLIIQVLPWSRNVRVHRFLEDAAFGIWMGSLYVVACAMSLAMASGDTLDHWLAWVDVSLLGAPAAEVLIRLLPGAFWRESLHLAYFCYYLLVATALLLGHLGPRRDRGPHPSTLIATVFFACCLAYLFLPAVGPLHAHDELFPIAGPFTALVNMVYAMAPDHGGGALPSSHVAVGLASVYVIARRAPLLGAVMSVPLAGLCVATLYCSYHYLLDVPTGLFTGVLGILVVESLRWLRSQAVDRERRWLSRLEWVRHFVRHGD